jgi:ABC-type transport system involved in cytochrome c biogenesis permease component
MKQKKTFWMNVLFAILWVLFCLIFFATDIDYVEHTLIHKILSLGTQLLIFTTSIVTAIHLYKTNKILLGKVVIFANYSSVAVLIANLLNDTSDNWSAFISLGFWILLLFYSFLIAPFVINLKVLRNNYD